MSDKVETGSRPVGIFGGSFNPPHMGHVLACHYALLRWNLKTVVVVPSFAHPFGKELPPFKDRFAMCRLAFAHLGNHIELSDVESAMGGVGYTIEVVRELQKRHPGEQFRLLVGGDILADTKKWRDFDEIVEIAPMLVIPRISEGTVYGGTPSEAALPDISSTTIRNTLGGEKSPDGAVPATVLDYIREHGLYCKF